MPRSGRRTTRAHLLAHVVRRHLASAHAGATLEHTTETHGQTRSHTTALAPEAAALRSSAAWLDYGRRTPIQHVTSALTDATASLFVLPSPSLRLQLVQQRRLL